MKMKTRAVAALFAAGMMALTGFAGVQSILGGTITAVEKTMEENGRSSALSYSGEKGITGKVTEYKSLDDVVKNLEKGDGYKFVKIAGYGEKALVVAPRDDDPNDDHAGIAVFKGISATFLNTLFRTMRYIECNRHIFRNCLELNSLLFIRTGFPYGSQDRRYLYS